MSPFDAARYTRLLKGLEVVERRYAEVVSRERMDAECFDKAALALAARLASSANVETISQVANVSDGNHLSIANEFADEADGVRYLRGQDISGAMMLDDRNPVFIPQSEYDKLTRSHIFVNDVLVTIVGANTGQTALVDEAPAKLTANCKLGILRANNSKIEPAYLHAFLAGRYGQSQVQSSKRGGGQMGLILPDLKAINVARFSKDFEQMVANMSLLAHRTNRRRQEHIDKAEAVLLQTLGFENWRTHAPLSYVRSSNEALAAGRFDAEYFHPEKYAALVDLNAASDFMIGDLFSSIRELWQPGDGSPDELVRNYDLNDALAPFLDGRKSPVARVEIASTKKILHAGDLVVSRLRSYLREIAVVEPSADYPMVASTEYIVLRPREKLSLPVEALLVYLRSPLPQIVLKWSQDGSNHPRFDEKEILRMPVPRALIANPAPYVEALQALKSARQRAAKLLDAAKRAVEVAIEDGESVAMSYLKTFE
ncbi:MAG: hypothetical protein Tsb007_26950 [Rhizobacter sp.]